MNVLSQFSISPTVVAGLLLNGVQTEAWGCKMSFFKTFVSLKAIAADFPLELSILQTICCKNLVQEEVWTTCSPWSSSLVSIDDEHCFKGLFCKVPPCQEFYSLYKPLVAKETLPLIYIYMCVYTHIFSEICHSRNIKRLWRLLSKFVHFPRNCCRPLVDWCRRRSMGLGLQEQYRTSYAYCSYPLSMPCNVVFFKNRCFSKGTCNRFSTWALHPTDHLLQGPPPNMTFLKNISQGDFPSFSVQLTLLEGC